MKGDKTLWQGITMGRNPYRRRAPHTTRSYGSSASSSSLTSAAYGKYRELWDEIYETKFIFRKFKSPPLPHEHKSKLIHARVKSLVAIDEGEIIGKVYTSPVTNPKYDAMFLIYVEMQGYPGRGVDILTDGIKYKYSYRTAKSHVFMPNLQLSSVKLTTADKHKLDEAIALWETEGDWVCTSGVSSSSSSCPSCSGVSSSCSRSYTTNTNTTINTNQQIWAKYAKIPIIP